VGRASFEDGRRVAVPRDASDRALPSTRAIARARHEAGRDRRADRGGDHHRCSVEVRNARTTREGRGSSGNEARRRVNLRPRRAIGNNGTTKGNGGVKRGVDCSTKILNSSVKMLQNLRGQKNRQPRQVAGRGNPTLSAVKSEGTLTRKLTFSLSPIQGSLSVRHDAECAPPYRETRHTRSREG